MKAEAKKAQTTDKSQEMKTQTTNQTKGLYESQVQTLPIEKLAVPVSHPRKFLGSVDSLQKNIRKIGLIEPLKVTLDDDGTYMVIDGSRRLGVLAEFGWKEVPCIVQKKMSMAEITHLAFVVNYERKSLNAIEVAKHLVTMKERFSYSHRELEAMGYGAAPGISQKIKLLDLSKKVQDSIMEGKITPAHGLELLKLPEAKVQEKMATQINDYGWTAKRLSIAISKFLKKGKNEKQRVTVPDGDIPGVYFKDSKDMSELPDKSAHLIISSPPYHVGHGVRERDFRC
jgi:ParB/RepB/Spo0J family partition protein